MAIRSGTCVQCGTQINSSNTGPMPKRCAECRTAKAKPKPYDCVVCGVEFLSHQSWAKFCGVDCRKKYASARAKLKPSKAKPPHLETCEQCGNEYLTVRTKRFCSARCAYLGNARTCEQPGCNNVHIAKGLCRSHYYKTYPSERKSETVECVVCQTMYVRRYDGPKRAAKYLPCCSTKCRTIVGKGWRTDLPTDHWARQYGQHMAVAYTRCKFCRNLFAHDARQQRTYCSLHNKESRPRFVSASCNDCGKPVMLDRQAFQSTAGYGHAYCGTACNRRASKRRRRAREYNAPGEFRWVDMIGLWLALDKCCAYCGVQSDKQPDPDHVIPLSRGGDNTIDNILPACRSCNGQKRTLTIAEWTIDRQERGKPPLSHPWRAMGWRRLEHLPGGMHLDVA